MGHRDSGLWLRLFPKDSYQLGVGRFNPTNFSPAGIVIAIFPGGWWGNCTSKPQCKYIIMKLQVTLGQRLERIARVLHLPLLVCQPWVVGSHKAKMLKGTKSGCCGLRFQMCICVFASRSCVNDCLLYQYVHGLLTSFFEDFAQFSSLRSLFTTLSENYDPLSSSIVLHSTYYCLICYTA